MTRDLDERICVWSVALIVFAFWALVMYSTTHRDQPEATPYLVSTNATTVTTEWPQSSPSLPEGFDPQALKPKHSVKHATHPTGVLADMIRRTFSRFGAETAEQAVRVAGCESTGDETGQNLNEYATNGAHAGLFQLSRTYHEGRARSLGYSWDEMFSAQPNIDVAADLFAEQGWSPWTCRWAA